MMLQDFTSLSNFIPALCKDITKSWEDKSNLAILDIASGYHSYMLDISKRCKEKVCMHQSKYFVNCLQLNNAILFIIVCTILANK